jgi:hypothetical protein
MEYWSVAVRRQLGIAPRVRGVGSAFTAHTFGSDNPGLKTLGYDLEPGAPGESRGSRFSVCSFSLRFLRSFAAIPFQIFSHSLWNTPGLSTRS